MSIALGFLLVAPCNEESVGMSRQTTESRFDIEVSMTLVLGPIDSN